MAESLLVRASSPPLSSGRVQRGDGMLVLLALGGITFVVWMAMLGLSFLDQEQVASLRMSVKRGKDAVRIGKE